MRIATYVLPDYIYGCGQNVPTRYVRRRNGPGGGWLACSSQLCVFFFFSSRRRHTRSLCDWSSDVCSSDLTRPGIMVGRLRIHYPRDEQHRIRTPELGVVQRSAHSREALLHDRPVARRQWIFPMIHVHHGVDADVRRLSGFLDFLDLALVRLRWHLRDFEADVSRQFEPYADAT